MNHMPTILQDCYSEVYIFFTYKQWQSHVRFKYNIFVIAYTYKARLVITLLMDMCKHLD